MADAHLPVTIRVRGMVIRGFERSKRIGFPTANLVVSTSLPEGVFAGTCIVRRGKSESSKLAAIAVEHRPSNDPASTETMLSVHLVGFAGDLIGSELDVELRSHLRPLRDFGDTPDHVRQLLVDVEAILAWARIAGLEALVEVSREPRWVTGPRGQRKLTAPKADRSTLLLRRALRREEALACVVASTPADLLGHELVARATGIPLPYLKWRFPTLDSLRRATDERAHTDLGRGEG